VWRRVAESLADEFHCWAIDLRGHGDSPLPPDDDLDWSGFGRDIAAAVDAIDGAGNTIGVAHSLGAAGLVMAELARPGLFRELYLYEPAIRRHNGQAPPDQLKLQEFFINAARTRRSSFPSREAALANFARKPPMAQFQAASLVDYVDHGFVDSADAGSHVELKCAPSTEALCYTNGFGHDIASRLVDVDCRVTLMKGSLTSDDQHEAIAAIAPDLRATVLVLDGAGHFGPMELPTRFASLVRHGCAGTTG
jgi:pimeloyl-ACP methyl ester carboxylesterase